MTSGQYQAQSDPRGYTPTTEDIRDEWRYNVQEVDIEGNVVVSFEEADAQFQRWLAQHDAEVKAAALREAADAVLHNTADPVYVGDSSEYARGYRQGLRDATRALRRKAKQGDERCTSCGCELAYPTAVHLLDCRLTEKGQGDE